MSAATTGIEVILVDTAVWVDHFRTGNKAIDIHLLAAVRLTAGAELWVNDKRLRGIAVEMALAFKARQHCGHRESA